MNKNLIYAFKFLDKEKSGIVGIKKIMKVLRKNSKKYKDVLKNSIKEVEKDNDGIINFEESKELMLRLE